MFENSYVVKDPIYLQPVVKPLQYQQNKNDIIPTNQQNQNNIYEINQEEFNQTNQLDKNGLNLLLHSQVRNNKYPINQLDESNVYEVKKLKKRKMHLEKQENQNKQYPSKENGQNENQLYPQRQQNQSPSNQQEQNIEYSVIQEAQTNIFPMNQENQYLLNENNLYQLNQKNQYQEKQLNQNNVSLSNQNFIYQTNQQNDFRKNQQNKNNMHLIEQQNRNLVYPMNQLNENNYPKDKPKRNNAYPIDKYPMDKQNKKNIYPMDKQKGNNAYPMNPHYQNNINPTKNQQDQNTIQPMNQPHNKHNINPINQQNQNNIYPIYQPNHNFVYPIYQQNQKIIYPMDLQNQNNVYQIEQQYQNNVYQISQKNVDTINNQNNVTLNPTYFQSQKEINNPNQKLITDKTIFKEKENNLILNKNQDKNNMSKKNNYKINKNKNKNNNSNKKKAINKLKLNEEILLRNQKITLNKDLDIKTNFEIEVTKERYLFNYKKVLKIAMPLLSHYEMPSDCEYKSPQLSPDGQFLSCIVSKTNMDTVYIWDLDDLYWYKYNFFFPKTKVDCVAFTPNSKSVLIIYRRANPILYSLENGEKIMEFEKNSEQNNKEGFNFAFTMEAGHFGYTTEKGYTLWNMKNGNIKQHIDDESPIKILFNEYIIIIKNDLICEFKYINTFKKYLSFKLKGIQSPNEILDARCMPDMSAFIYVIKQGIIKYIFKDKQFKGLQKFQTGVGTEKATISDDCRFVVKTNMRNLTIYDIEKGDTIGTILKEKFNEYKIDFNNEKLIVIDNICINIHDYTDGGIPEQFIWLNKNPSRFLDAKFSHDFKFLFALIDNNNVIAYDLNTGLIIKKWQNIDKNWNNFSISEFSGNEVASNSNLFLVKLWNYITGREDATFYGFDSHSFHFSSNGNYLACGAKNGPEVARIWNIEKGTFGSFPYVGNNSNFHTIVHLTSPEPTRLICCSIDQQPLIFDTNSKELLYKCECLYRFEEIYEIKSDQKYDVFIVKGRDVKKRDIGLLYRISDGILLETYENYTVLELAKDNGIIISKCDNVNGGKLTSIDVKNLSDPILNDFQIQTDKIKLLNDNKCVVVVTNGDEYKTEYCLMNAEDGGYFGKINFVKKSERNSENYITIDPTEEFIYFRYFEFLSPQESRILRNKLFFRNQGQ